MNFGWPAKLAQNVAEIKPKYHLLYMTFSKNIKMKMLNDFPSKGE